MSNDLNKTTTTDDESEDESVLSTHEVLEALKDQEKLEDDAVAVLGAINDKVCSYSNGYIKRQALYSCLTCIPETKKDPTKGAGVCLACSYHCHDGHELIELYTKRNFRCDCGNSKFSNLKCNLIEQKDDVNESNNYNQNFAGSYCVCRRPYPDAEDPLPDEMMQCSVCEDWYHTRHLGAEVPSNYSEMICGPCVSKHEFLLYYDHLTSNKLDSSDVNVVDELPEEKETTTNDNKKCRKPLTKSENNGTKFYRDLSWRQELCTCSNCLELYKNENVAFLIDSEDTVHAYEEKGKAHAKEYFDKRDQDMLKSMDRVGVVEFLTGYNDLKESLGEFLQGFANNKRVVRVEDVNQFFEQMKAKKKQKTGDGCPPAFCH